MNKFIEFINKHRFEAITGAIFIIYLTLTLTLTYVTYPRWLTSDMTAELIAAKQAFDEGKILSPNWYYGTELRLLSPTLLYQFLFLFTSDFWAIRATTIPIVLIILFLSLYFLMRQSKYNKYFFLVATFMLLPMSVNSSYFTYVISGYQMYAFYITLMFISLGLMFYYLNHRDKIRRIISASLIGIIALLCGINGPRHLLVLYAPWFLTCLLLYLLSLKKIKKYEFKSSLKTNRARALYLSTGAIIINGVGLLIYFYVMLNRFHLTGYDIKIVWPDIYTFKNAFENLLSIFGYNKLGGAFGVLSNIVLVLSLIFLLAYFILLPFNYRKLKDHERFYTYFFLFGMAGLLGYFLFVRMSLKDGYILQYSQYFIFNALFAWILAAIFIKQFTHKKIKKKTTNIIKYSYAIMFLLAASFSYSTFFGYNPPLISMKNTALNLKPFVEIIKEKKYTFGYASHWQGAILTELTDQQVDMYVFVSGANKIIMNKEVQSIKHSDFIRNEHCFIIFSQSETSMPAFDNALDYGGTLLMKRNQLYLIDLPTAEILNQ